MNGLPTLAPAGNTHSRIYPPVPLLYVLDIGLSIVVVSPLAHSTSEANPPDVHGHFYNKSLVPFAAAAAFIKGTFKVSLCTFNG
ncbi:MAG: hypothetical protein EZS28_027388 [Streblomastix strix]|uniref:Uncharacterized protein n=1 Tax=Streblomastix strix TaxID=222440 RepID=A0A5J4V2B1_9EUKA|nr:MAG: hypothetical protein EZS28_027388 [Streblomastix strix]